MTPTWPRSTPCGAGTPTAGAWTAGPRATTWRRPTAGSPWPARKPTPPSTTSPTATVDYLFGWDATTGVVTDWMYEQPAASYVRDDDPRKFLETSNPWA